MHFRLPPGVTFCETGGRIIFLDIGRDRYFGLPAAGERAFRRLADGETLDGEDRAALASLARSGLLDPCEEPHRPSPCPPGPKARTSLLDESAKPRWSEMAGALSRLATARLVVRLRPLSSTLLSFERRKAGAKPLPAEQRPQLLEVASAFRVSRLIASPLDRCLPRSLAAAHRLLDHGITPELVFGVRLQPFAAHCWVRHGSVLVTESLDQARKFTPILIL
jgi:hypothetical protein